MPQRRRTSVKMRRLVTLSSTTNTDRPGRNAAASGRTARLGAAPNRAVKWNELPRPGALSTQIRPCIASTRRAEMVSPSPVPPYWRVMEPSAWENASKISFCFSGAMPMPVSRIDEMQFHLLRRAFFHRHFQGHLAGLRELDGVAQQIDDHLANSDRIAHHVIGNVRPSTRTTVPGLSRERAPPVRGLPRPDCRAG